MFINAGVAELEAYCPKGVDQLLTISGVLGLFDNIIILCCIGLFTALVQKITVMRMKDNVELQVGRVGLEASIVIVSCVYLYIKIRNP